MKNIISYFSNAPDSHRIAILFLSIFILWNLENLFAIAKDYNKWKHSFTNGKFVFIAAPIQLLMGFVLIFCLNWTEASHFGILQISFFQQSSLLLFIASFLFLDFFEYVYHVLMHKINRLWMFHVVHHSDRNVDVSTVLREHPGETMIRLTFLCVFVLISGIPLWALIFRQFIQIFSNAFGHSNFRLPNKINKIIGLVFITPNIHHVHHHVSQPYTDSNYGDVLSIWDRIFGTFLTLEAENTKFGIDTYLDKKENEDFKKLIQIPFQVYRAPK